MRGIAFWRWPEWSARTGKLISVSRDRLQTHRVERGKTIEAGQHKDGPQGMLKVGKGPEKKCKKYSGSTDERVADRNVVTTSIKIILK